MPDVMPSMDFKRVWQSGPLSVAAAASSAGRPGARASRVLSVWRPVGPPGYSSLGDVVVDGSEPPSGKPVRMYKDVLGAGDAPGQVSTARTHQRCRQALLAPDAL
jgi:vacuolar protein sorting-associated protein 13A/C